jgi:hypothetical protein
MTTWGDIVRAKRLDELFDPEDRRPPRKPRRHPWWRFWARLGHPGERVRDQVVDDGRTDELPAKPLDGATVSFLQLTESLALPRPRAKNQLDVARCRRRQLGGAHLSRAWSWSR